MSQSKNKILTILGVCTIPLISFPLLLCEIANRRKYAMYLLAFMMGLWAIWLLPTGDLYRHTLLYYELKEYDLSQFMGFLKIRPDCLFYVLVYVFAKINLPFEWIRLLSTFGGYAIYFFLFFDYIKNNPVAARKRYLFVFSLFFFYVPFIDMGCGIRFAFSTALLALAMYRLYIHRKKSAYLWGVIACLIHFGQIPLFFLICICQYFHRIRFKFFFLLVSFLLIIGGHILFAKMIGVLPINEVYQRIIIAYTEEFSASEVTSLFTKIYGVFSQLPVLMSVLYLLLTRRQSNFMALSILLFMLYSLMFAFPIGNRYSSFFLFTVLMAYLQGDFQVRQNSWYSVCVLFLFSFIFIMKFYYLRQIIPSNRTLSFVCSPSLVTLLHQDSLSLILQNVDEDGSLLKVF